MQTTSLTVRDYFNALPAKQKAALKALRAAIKETASGAEEMIRSRVPAFHYKGRYLVSYGASKQHLSFFVMQGDAMNVMKDELKGYDISNKVIRFTEDSPLPVSLVKKIVKMRIREIEERLKALGSKV